MGAVRFHDQEKRLNTIPVYQLAVIGAGIHGVHLLTSIVEASIVPEHEILLVDPHEKPLAVWERRVRNCTMQYLRSPASHGLDPDFRALRRTMNDAGDAIPPYHRPSSALFARHAQARIRSYAREVACLRGEVRSVNTDADERFRLHIQSDYSQPAREHTCIARAVILCPGPPPPYIPPLFAPLHGTVQSLHHVYDLHFDPEEVQAGEEVLVVGGGIGALHLAPSLVARGAVVSLWTRDRLSVHQFDSDPCFIGPRCGTLYDEIRDEKLKLTLLNRARRRGSVPPDLYRKFRDDTVRGRYRYAHGEVDSIERSGDRYYVTGHRKGADCSRRLRQEFDRVVLCTGFADQLPAANLVDEIIRNTAAQKGAGGFPRVEEDLAWIPGLFVSGGLADLILGPPARNIVGAHLARRRIIPALKEHLTRR